jgi:hypothetical protein
MPDFWNLLKSCTCHSSPDGREFLDIVGNSAKGGREGAGLWYIHVAQAARDCVVRIARRIRVKGFGLESPLLVDCYICLYSIPYKQHIKWKVEASANAKQLLLNAPSFLNRQFLWNRFSSPPVSDNWYGTELTPLLFDGVGCICMILIENGSATLSLLNKVCNSI